MKKIGLPLAALAGVAALLATSSPAQAVWCNVPNMYGTKYICPTVLPWHPGCTADGTFHTNAWNYACQNAPQYVGKFYYYRGRLIP